MNALRHYDSLRLALGATTWAAAHPAVELGSSYFLHMALLCAMLIAILVLAPLVGALSVVRRIALPPAETGFSISRLSWPASCCAQDRTSTSGDWALHQQALLSCVLLPTAYLYVQ